MTKVYREQLSAEEMTRRLVATAKYNPGWRRYLFQSGSFALNMILVLGLALYTLDWALSVPEYKLLNDFIIDMLILLAIATLVVFMTVRLAMSEKNALSNMVGFQNQLFSDALKRAEKNCIEQEIELADSAVTISCGGRRLNVPYSYVAVVVVDEHYLVIIDSFASWTILAKPDDEFLAILKNKVTNYCNLEK